MKPNPTINIFKKYWWVALIVGGVLIIGFMILFQIYRKKKKIQLLQLNNKLLEAENQAPDTLKYVSKNQAVLIQESKGKFELTIYQFLARFASQEIIGKGTFSCVQKYRDSLTDEVVAVKSVQLTSAELLETQSHEVQQMIKCQKYNSYIRLLHYVITKSEDQQSGTAYLVMELADQSLDNLIKISKSKNKYLSEEQICDLLIALVNVLYSLHINENISHKDIKPSNILLKNGQFKLSELGSTKEDIAAKSGITLAKGSTIHFISPKLRYYYEHMGESIQVLEVNYIEDYFKSDIFSLGLTMLQACTLKRVNNFNVDKDNLVAAINYCKTLSLYNGQIIKTIEDMLAWEDSDRPNIRQVKASITRLENYYAKSPSRITSRFSLNK